MEKIFGCWGVLLMLSVSVGCSDQSDAMADSNSAAMMPTALGTESGQTDDTVKAVVANGFDLTGSSIPVDMILPGGPAKDGIPALDNPNFVSAAQARLDGDDWVVGLTLNGESRAYPIAILNWHEVVNDHIGEQTFSVTFCPLCGSAMVFYFPDQPIQLGVSGLLYNSDVLLYDRETESLWSQLKAEAVVGSRQGEQFALLAAQQMRWRQWRAQHPETQVLSVNTGYWRDYHRDPYAGYEQTESTYFPYQETERLHRYGAKEKVLTVFIEAEAVRGYPWSELRKRGQKQWWDQLGDQRVLIHWDDASDTAWVTAGQVDFSSKQTVKGVISYWFAWQAFYPNVDLYRYLD